MASTKLLQQVRHASYCFNGRAHNDFCPNEYCSRKFNSNAGNADDYIVNDDENDMATSLRYFNISDCGTYSHLWLWDLALSCGEGDDGPSHESCECTTAEILRQYGDIECDGDPRGRSACPDGCPVCDACMRMVGCDPDASSSREDDGPLSTSGLERLGRGASRVLPIALGAAAGLAFAVVGLSMYQHTRSSIGGLDAQFMPAEPPMV